MHHRWNRWSIADFRRRCINKTVSILETDTLASPLLVIGLSEKPFLIISIFPSVQCTDEGINSFVWLSIKRSKEDLFLFDEIKGKRDLASRQTSRRKRWARFFPAAFSLVKPKKKREGEIRKCFLAINKRDSYQKKKTYTVKYFYIFSFHFAIKKNAFWFIYYNYLLQCKSGFESFSFLEL